MWTKVRGEDLHPRTANFAIWIYTLSQWPKSQAYKRANRPQLMVEVEKIKTVQEKRVLHVLSEITNVNKSPSYHCMNWTLIVTVSHKQT